tara:strand:+ start:676 stop:897 length:222 start_codon:yes stop_codon:yes gene_type:complete
MLLLPFNNQVNQMLSSILILHYFINVRRKNMSIKPGPKPKADTTGKTDKRRRVTPENKDKHPKLKEHEHKKGK